MGTRGGGGGGGLGAHTRCELVRGRGKRQQPGVRCAHLAAQARRSKQARASWAGGNAALGDW